jgi:hypothetical protein
LGISAGRSDEERDFCHQGRRAGTAPAGPPALSAGGVHAVGYASGLRAAALGAAGVAGDAAPPPMRTVRVPRLRTSLVQVASCMFRAAG